MTLNPIPVGISVGATMAVYGTYGMTEAGIMLVGMSIIFGFVQVITEVYEY